MHNEGKLSSASRYILLQHKLDLWFKLDTVKGSIDNLSPAKYPHIAYFEPGKSNYNRKQKRDQIRQENMILDDKISSASSSLCPVKRYHHQKSLNIHQRKQNYTRIVKDNKQLAKSLRSVESNYSLKSLEKFRTQINSLVSQISAYPAHMKNPSLPVMTPSVRRSLGAKMVPNRFRSVRRKSPTSGVIYYLSKIQRKHP